MLRNKIPIGVDVKEYGTFLYSISGSNDIVLIATTARYIDALRLMAPYADEISLMSIDSFYALFEQRTGGV